jgi:hypothetical protein
MKEIRTRRHINMKGSAKKDVFTVLLLQETETFYKLKTLTLSLTAGGPICPSLL